MEENILICDWKGMMAHFRQFDSNSSSLSYSFPPPTVITGMIAGILGVEKDSYYKLFNKERLRMGIQITTPPRKMMQTINYIYAKSPGDLNMSGDNIHTQIPAELLVTENFPHSPLLFRLFFKFSDNEIFQEVSSLLQETKFKYLPFLGSAPFTSWLEWIGIPDRIELEDSNNEQIVDTVIPANVIDPQSLKLDSIDGKPPAYLREHIRREFLPGREPGDLMDIIWERNRSKIWAKFNCTVYKLEFKEKKLNAVFL